MAVNRGKQFEEVVRQAFEAVEGVSVDRLHDQTTGYIGSSNICDFIVYKKPYEYYIECKSVHGNTLSIHSVPKPNKHGVLHGLYGSITDTQWEGLLAKTKIKGVVAGILCWWVDTDVTKFLPIQELAEMRSWGMKSVHYNMMAGYKVEGQKKRVFYDYDMLKLLKRLESKEDEKYE